jgi:hypothetical protein
MRVICITRRVDQSVLLLPYTLAFPIDGVSQFVVWSLRTHHYVDPTAAECKSGRNSHGLSRSAGSPKALNRTRNPRCQRQEVNALIGR